MPDWYILTDIPYLKEFPPLYKTGDAPKHEIPWYIDTDIPYLKEFPELYTIAPAPIHEEPWYILDDIPYMKEFPPLYKTTTPPTHEEPWYILTDIPYLKEFPELYRTGQPPIHEEPWYILNDIPYLKEFPPLYGMGQPPVHDVPWYILNDIPYLKEFPPLYGVWPIVGPSELQYYVIGLGSVGRWQIRRWVESEPEEWTVIEDIGPPSAVMSACIEADGDFDYKAGDESITLTTTATPWMAVITTTKKLYVKQVRADIETAILLDTDVEQASLCRGWKSDKYGVDSGLICAYRKQNGVFAKVYKKVNGEYAWETLPQLLYGSVEHVEVKRLNDYRIGVYVTNPNRLLISERFYIGDTSETEFSP